MKRGNLQITVPVSGCVPAPLPASAQEPQPANWARIIKSDGFGMGLRLQLIRQYLQVPPAVRHPSHRRPCKKKNERKSQSHRNLALRFAMFSLYRV